MPRNRSDRVHAHLGAMEVGEQHPCAEPDGYPEFEVTLTYYVTSFDPEAVEAARRTVAKHLADVVVDDISEYVV